MENFAKVCGEILTHIDDWLTSLFISLGIVEDGESTKQDGQNAGVSGDIQPPDLMGEDQDAGPDDQNAEGGEGFDENRTFLGFYSLFTENKDFNEVGQRLHIFLCLVKELVVLKVEETVSAIAFQGTHLDCTLIFNLYYSIACFINSLLLYQLDLVTNLLNILDVEEPLNFLDEMLRKFLEISTYLLLNSPEEFLERSFYFVNLTIQLTYFGCDTNTPVFNNHIKDFTEFLYKLAEGYENGTFAPELVVSPLIKLISRIFIFQQFSDIILKSVKLIFTASAGSGSIDLLGYVSELISKILSYLSNFGTEGAHAVSLGDMIKDFYGTFGSSSLVLFVNLIGNTVENVFSLDIYPFDKFLDLYSDIKSWSQEEEVVEMLETLFEVNKLVKCYLPVHGELIDLFNNEFLYNDLPKFLKSTKVQDYSESISNIFCDISSSTVLSGDLDIINCIVEVFLSFGSEDFAVVKKLALFLTSALLNNKNFEESSRVQIVFELIIPFFRQKMSDDYDQYAFPIYIDLINSLIIRIRELVPSLSDEILYVIESISCLDRENVSIDVLRSYTNLINTLLVLGEDITSLVEGVVEFLERMVDVDVRASETLILIDIYCGVFEGMGKTPEFIFHVCNNVITGSSSEGFVDLAILRT